MAVNSVANVPQLLYANGQSPKILAGNKDGVFVDFVGLYCKSSKRIRRRIGYAAANRRSLTNNKLNAVLDLERVASNASQQSSDIVPKVANLDDILSERGACGVGFIANLDNKASHGIVKDALVALGCMEHRGGCGADNDSGDGSGLMTSIPWDLFNDWAEKEGIAVFDKLHTGVGMVFLPKDYNQMNEAKKDLFSLSTSPEGKVADFWSPQGWNIIFRRLLNDWEVDRVAELLQIPSRIKGLSAEIDSIKWRHARFVHQGSEGANLEVREVPGSRFGRTRFLPKVNIFLVGGQESLSHS